MLVVHIIYSSSQILVPIQYPYHIFDHQIKVCLLNDMEHYQYIDIIMAMKHERSPSLCQSFSCLHSIQIDHFATHGWVCVPSLLSPSELQMLQTESNLLYSCQSAESIAAQGCVIDVLAQYPMKDYDKVRVDSSSYLNVRCAASDMDTQQVFASFLFEKLPAIVGKLLSACDKSKTVTDMFFFNDHYVVKPPKSHVEFRWHRDDDEQLAMCVHRDSIRPYVSAWCALDDVTKLNGALQFVSLNVPRPNENNCENMHLVASDPVSAKAGDVLFFLSNVWHCSSSNESDGIRRAFYAQYSREKITSRPKDPTPLQFAIPCKLYFGG